MTFGNSSYLQRCAYTFSTTCFWSWLVGADAMMSDVARYEAMGFLVNELKMSSRTSGFKGIPLQLSKHFGNAGLGAEVIGNKPF